MAKKTVKQVIENWDAADQQIRELGDLLLEINQKEATAKKIIDRETAKLSEAVKPLQDKMKSAVKLLKKFAVKNRIDFEGAQSRKLNFGILGWRKSTSIDAKLTTPELIRKVFGKAGEKYIRQAEESVNKDVIKELTDEQLTSVNAQRDNKEVFFVEPSLPKAVDYDETQSL